MNFEQMDFDTFFKLAAIPAEPFDEVVSRVVSNAMFHELDTSVFETPEFYQFYGKTMIAEGHRANTAAFYEQYGRALLFSRSFIDNALKENKDI